MTRETLAAGHASLLPELAQLRALARQVFEAHRSEDGARLREVSALITDLLEDLALHLRDEERAGFVPHRELRRDHAQVRLLLADLRCHTEGYRVPPGSCASWRELWSRLAALHAALTEQMDEEDRFAAR